MADTARALILDGDSDAAIEALQSLGRAGVQVDVSAPRKCLAFRSRYVRERHDQVPVTELEAFTAWLRGLDARARYDLIVPSTEQGLRGVRGLAPGDPLRVRAVLPSDEALDVALDKQRTWALARALAVPVPACSLIESLDHLPEVREYPVVLKTTRSLILAGGRSVDGAVALIEHPEGRLEFLREYLPYGPVQQQSYVSGWGFGIEVLYDRGRLAWHFAHERIHEGPSRGGASSNRRSIEPPVALLAAATKLLDALRWHGVAMVEFRGRGDGPFHLMEINPRLWGSLSLAIDAGVDFPVGLLRLARDEPLAPQPSYRKHYYTRNVFEDVHWQLSNLKADHRDSRLLTRPRLASVLEPLRVLVGRESWDHFDWRDLAVTGGVLRAVADQLAGRVHVLWARRVLTRRLRRRHARLLAARRPGGRPIETILFLCYGNLCRSPFAAEVSRRTLPSFKIESSGFAETPGRRTPEEIVEIALARGIDLSAHLSNRLGSERVARADLILVMDADNYQLLAHRFPDALPRTTMLGLFASPPSLEIQDPYGVPAPQATQSLEVVLAAVDGLGDWLARRSV